MVKVIVPATLDHVADLAPRLRARDLAEIEAASGRPVADALTESLDRALWAEALVVDGRVEALGGLGTLSMMFGPGVPWLVGSDRLTERKRWFLVQSRRQVRRMLGSYDMLANYVDARNRPAIAFLRWLGFVLEPAAPWGQAGLPFHRFTMERERATIRAGGSIASTLVSTGLGIAGEAQQIASQRAIMATSGRSRRTTASPPNCWP